jgi:MtfA peptidase
LPILVIIGLGLLISLWMFGKPYWKYQRRQRIRRQPFPEAWRQILKRRMPYFRRMPADLQLQLKKHIQVFLAEKVFVGCDGIVVTDEMRVTIAAQACLLLLNRKTDYFPQLSQILIYPSAFIVNKNHADASGLVTEQRQVLAGESWQQGQVILSWQDTVADAEVHDDGRNVVIHEFAHQLDQENGPANGAPILARSEHYQSWSQTMQREFEQLRWQTGTGQPALLNPYGATNPAEFFAVVTEVFFERPTQLAEQHPSLYAELSRFYRLDPLSW